MEVWRASVRSPFAPAKCGNCGHIRQSNAIWIAVALLFVVLGITALALLLPRAG